MSISFYIISLFYKNTKIEDLKELIDDSKNIDFIDLYKDLIIKKKFLIANNSELIDEENLSNLNEKYENDENLIISLIKIPKNEKDYKDFFNKQTIKMDTPLNGKIYLTYDYENNIFNYYSNSREIPYNILDVLCRKFILTYDLLDKYNINYTYDYYLEDEYDNISENSLEKNEELNNEFEDILEEDKKEEEEEEEEYIGPFKKLKKRAKEYKTNTKNYEKKINIFKYAGNFYDYDENYSEKNKNIKKELNYNDFKNIKDKED